MSVLQSANQNIPCCRFHQHIFCHVCDNQVIGQKVRTFCDVRRMFSSRQPELRLVHAAALALPQGMAGLLATSVTLSGRGRTTRLCHCGASKAHLLRPDICSKHRGSFPGKDLHWYTTTMIHHYHPKVSRQALSSKTKHAMGQHLLGPCNIAHSLSSALHTL